LTRVNPSLTEKEFESKLSTLVPVDMNVQKALYQLIDSKRPFSEVLEKSNLNRSVWTPVMFNLLSSGILSVSNEPDVAAGTAALEAAAKVFELPTATPQAYSPEAGVTNLAKLDIDQPASMEDLSIDLTALETFTKSMTHPESGIYSEIA